MKKASDILPMSGEEINRVQVLQQLVEGHLKAHQAAKRLGLSVRQVRRLKKAFKRGKAQAIVSKKRGRPSNHQLAPTVKQRALDLLRERYADFGPTLAHEKLSEQHGLKLGRETVRQLMIEAKLWQAHKAKRPVLHPLRERRTRLGELVQIDGSPFDWFEGRAPACTLLVFIDDATGQLLELWFTPAETTFSYMEATEHYLRRNGKPLAVYSDKYGVFRVNKRDTLDPDALTQFGRALKELDIELICANSPQAKGRVERANQTLQDRLVKEMRLRNISSIEAGNTYCEVFRADFNRRFGRPPRQAGDAHRPLRPQDDLARILTLQEERRLSKNLTLQYARKLYQIQTTRPSYALRHAKVTVCENRLGEVTITYKGKPLAYQVYQEQAPQAQEVPSKLLNQTIERAQVKRTKRKAHIPAADHPWRRMPVGRSSNSTSSPG